MRRLVRATGFRRLVERQRLFASWQTRLGQATSSAAAARGYETPLLLLAFGGMVATVARSSSQRSSASASSAILAGEAADAVESSPEQAHANGRSITLTDVYDVCEVIGHGHFAIVRRGVHKETGEAVAIKAIEKGRTDVSAIRREVAILQKVGSHPNIVALRDVFETEDEWFLVMELVTGGELFEKLVKQGPYSEKEASRLMRQMARAIAWLHSQGVVHRDLKPENLLLSSTGDGDITVKLCDFGLSVALGQDGVLDEKQGTWAYWAPEMWSGQYGKQVDMWSLGVILYILLSGRHPFDAPGRTDAQMRRCIQTGELSFAHASWADVSDEAKQARASRRASFAARTAHG
jgi:calcium/calmodulin-dependent protein kinase I